MSIWVMDQVWKRSTHKGSALLMLLAIADNANEECEAFPSVSTLAKKCRMTERNARMVLKQLEESAELEIVEGGGTPTRYGPTNLYIVHIDRMPEPRGVKPASEVKRASGVKPASARGEKSGKRGVKPASGRTLTELSVNHHDDVGGDTDKPQPPKQNESVIGKLIDLGCLRRQAIGLAKKNPNLTPEVLDCWVAWQQTANVNNPVGLMIAYLQEGRIEPPASRTNGKTNGKPQQSMYQQPGESHDDWQRRLQAAVRVG